MKSKMHFVQNMRSSRNLLLHIFIVTDNRFITFLNGLNNTRHNTKFDMQCMISNGIPATHHENAVCTPLVITYVMEHSGPKSSPYSPANIAQNHTESCFLKSIVTRDNNGHMYAYIIHHKPNPYMHPSTRINAGTINNVSLPKCNV